MANSIRKTIVRVAESAASCRASVSATIVANWSMICVFVIPMNSRNKGARGERMWRDQLREAGFRAIRGCQNAGRDAGGGEAPDIICPDLPKIHHEVKFVEKLNLQDAMNQAVRDAKPGQIPIVAHKRKNCDWNVTVRAEDWFKILKQTDLVCGS